MTFPTVGSEPVATFNGDMLTVEVMRTTQEEVGSTQSYCAVTKRPMPVVCSRKARLNLDRTCAPNPVNVTGSILDPVAREPYVASFPVLPLVGVNFRGMATALERSAVP